jgi:hypothetical protein
MKYKLSTDKKIKLDVNEMRELRNRITNFYRTVQEEGTRIKVLEFELNNGRVIELKVSELTELKNLINDHFRELKE